MHDGTFIVQQVPPDEETILRRLRHRYPTWAFLHVRNQGLWYALQGKGTVLYDANPMTLRLRIDNFNANTDGRHEHA